MQPAREPDDDARPCRAANPPPSGSLQTRLVGRDRELAALVLGLDAALAGHGHLYLIGGEPGVGKTRLLEEVAAAAAARGAQVARGRCWEADEAPPLWPWVEMVRALARGRPVRPLRRLERLLVGPSRPTGPRTLAAPDPEFHRFAYLDDTATFLHGMARRKPLVLLLDDIHAADRGSLALLELLARGVRRSSLLIVATYREASGPSAGGWGERLGELARESTAIPLRGLDLAATGAFAAAATGRQPSNGLVAMLHDATGGNPFFLDEVLRLLVAEGRCDESNVKRCVGVPDRVRSAVRARLAHLPAASRAALEAAALIGREFEAEPPEVSGGTTDAGLGALSAAVAAGLIRPMVPSGFRFVHAVVREAICDDIPASRRPGPRPSTGVQAASPGYRIGTNSAVLQGEYWTFQYGGALSRLRDRAGLRYLATLLERPHDAVPALTLSAGPLPVAIGGRRATNADELRSGWPMDLGDVLDPRARVEYRARLEELGAWLEEAEAAGDLGRAGRLRAESGAIREALGAALGLGGRARRAGSPVERARVNVTRALRGSIARMRAADGPLGAHLARSVRTGTFCTYAPPDPTVWTVARPGAERPHTICSRAAGA